MTALLEVALLRAAAAEAGICDITQKGRQLVFRFTERVHAPSLIALCQRAGYRGRLLLHSGKEPYMTLHLKEGEDALAAAAAFAEQLKLKQEEITGAQPDNGGNEP